MSYKDYTNKLEQVLNACKINNINANMKQLQNYIVDGVCVDDIIENLQRYT